MTEPRLHRTAFSQSRAAEYLNLETLQKLTGRPASDFPRVVVKELLDDGAAALFFGAMCSQVKEPSHKVLGDPLGERHLVGSLRKLYGYGSRSWYKAVKTHLNGAPAVIEAAVVELEWKGNLFIGLERFELEDARAWIERGFERDDTQSWRDAVNVALQDTAREHKPDLEAAVRKHIRKTVAYE